MKYPASGKTGQSQIWVDGVATGAGDSWLAGFITARLRGFSLHCAGRFANAVGACCVQAIGASTGIRTFDETLRFAQRQCKDC